MRTQNEQSKNGADEHILVCLSSSPSNARIVHTAARMAKVLGARFTAIYVQTDTAINDEDRSRLSQNIQLAQRLGAEIVMTHGEDVPLQISEYVRLSDVTKIVIGQSILPTGKKAEEIERMESEIRTVGNIEEVSADVLEIFDYAALGHIHKPMKVGSEFYRYCGTPLACSVSEAQQQKGVVMVEMEEKGSTKMTVLPLTPLHQVRVIKGTLEEVLREACGDYVTVVLTDKIDLDVIDMQERIRLTFPNLLEIRRENQRKADYSRSIQEEELLDPYELCCSFLKEIDDEEKLILQDVLHTVQGVK